MLNIQIEISLINILISSKCWRSFVSIRKFLQQIFVFIYLIIIVDVSQGVFSLHNLTVCILRGDLILIFQRRLRFMDSLIFPFILIFFNKNKAFFFL